MRIVEWAHHMHATFSGLRPTRGRTESHQLHPARTCNCHAGVVSLGYGRVSSRCASLRVRIQKMGDAENMQTGNTRHKPATPPGRTAAYLCFYLLYIGYWMGDAAHTRPRPTHLWCFHFIIDCIQHLQKSHMSHVCHGHRKRVCHDHRIVQLDGNARAMQITYKGYEPYV